MPAFGAMNLGASLGVKERGREISHEREHTDTSHCMFSAAVIIMHTLHTNHILSFHLDWVLTPVVPPGVLQSASHI